MNAGLDYSYGPISPAAITSAGYRWVARYLDDPSESSLPKHLTPSEYAQLTGGGIPVYAVFEVDVDDWTGAFLGGVVFGTRAQAGAQWVGHTGPIFFTVDQHLTPAQIPVALDYLQGCGQVVGNDNLGVYGFSELIQAAQAAEIGSYYWQCGDQPSANAGVNWWQRNDDGGVVVGVVSCDVNVELIPVPVGADMTPEQEAKLDAVLAFVNSLYQQASGSMTLGEWPGWPSFPNGSGFSLTPVDYARQADAELVTLRADMAALQEQLAAPVAVSPGLTDEDRTAIAQQVVAELSQKLAS